MLEASDGIARTMSIAMASDAVSVQGIDVLWENVVGTMKALCDYYVHIVQE